MPDKPFIWSETTLAAGLAWRRLGEHSIAERIRVDMQTLVSPDAGTLYAFPKTDLRDDPILVKSLMNGPVSLPRFGLFFSVTTQSSSISRLTVNRAGGVTERL